MESGDARMSYAEEVESLYWSYRPDGLPEYLRQKLWTWCCRIVRQRREAKS